MQTGQPSRTAMAAARHRADHQELEGGSIFRDPLARAVLAGVEPRGDHLAHAGRQRMRGFIVLRARFAEDALADAVANGTDQAVVLGAGLDTFAYRNPYSNLRVFEVDHPATQEWKRERLAAAGIAIPDSVAYVPVDFERDDLGASLRAAGLAADRPAFVIWLGVTVYLTRAALAETLRALGELALGSELVFDYGTPIPPPATPEERTAHEDRERRLAAAGERWITFLTPAEAAELLRDNGFQVLEDNPVGALTPRYIDGAPAVAAGPRLVRARVGG
ncbi:class I SAM-dependent methyltransferase [Nocardia sp. NPDC004068]|uniref:class I SAM-dependent methyltransferase n=1 Tax=Nocardia sp. NPDC004068 TaxID=3364303 RepID=UPI003680B114